MAGDPKVQELVLFYAFRHSQAEQARALVKSAVQRGQPFLTIGTLDTFEEELAWQTFQLSLKAALDIDNSDPAPAPAAAPMVQETQQATPSAGDGSSWLNMLGDDRSGRGARPAKAEPTSSAVKVPSTSASDPLYASDPWSAGDPWGGKAQATGYTGGAAKAGDPWGGKAQGKGAAKAAATVPVSPAPAVTATEPRESSEASRPSPGLSRSREGGAAHRMLGVAMRSAGGNVRSPAASVTNDRVHSAGETAPPTSAASGGTTAPPKDVVPQKASVAKLKEFLLMKGKDLEEKKRVLRACVGKGKDILGAGVQMESADVEQAIREVEAAHQETPAASVATPTAVPAEPAAASQSESASDAAQDDWWTKKAADEAGSSWRTGDQWESRAGDAWSSDAKGWSSSDQQWQDGDGSSWWKGWSSDQQQWYGQEPSEESQQQAASTAGASTATATTASAVKVDPSEEEVVQRVLAYLKAQKDPEKGMRTIRSSQSGVSPHVAEAAIALFEGTERELSFGGFQ